MRDVWMCRSVMNHLCARRSAVQAVMTMFDKEGK